VVANFTDMTCSIPTPPPPTIPAITTGKNFTIVDLQVNGDVQVKGNVTCNSGTSTIGGNLSYTNNFIPSSHVTVQGTTSSVGSVNFPNIDYTYLQSQATNWGQVVAGDSTGQTFSFNSLGGNKVVWIQGNLKDPVVTMGGTYAAGGTILVDGTVTFSSSSTTVGADGYPVYIVSHGDVNQTGANLNLTGGIYTEKNLNHKTCTIVGPVVAKQSIGNTATGTCMFTAGAIPWFDNRVLPQAPTLPLYTASHRGNGP
jgi:hypothetical protein